jgi:N-methylhydantoinase A
MHRIGIDVGGTFTDVVLVDEATGASAVAKVLNEPGRKAETVVRGIQKLLTDAGVSPDQVAMIGHGTTIATNAVLERKGARVALITNKGFRDVLEIGRLSRPPELIYRVQDDKPPPLVPRHLRFEIDCRLDSSGHELRAVSSDEVDRLIGRLKSERVEAVAVSLLFSFLDPGQEKLIGERLRAALPGVYVLLSSEVQPEFREFPRTSTTVFAAAVAPIIGTYLDRLQDGLAAAAIASPLYIFQSNGGVAQPQIVRRQPSTLFLSGPAGAVVGATQLAVEAGYRDMITLDMGGTSLDVCVLRDGVAGTIASREIDHFPIVSPMLDVHTVGAGGGSLCRLDEVGRLRVGPESAASDPGPACYGRGGNGLTLTDVNLVLGYLDPADFAGGSVRLYPEKAAAALRDAIALPLKMDPLEAAAGVWKVAANQMAEAIRYVTVQRGLDPRGFDLVAFGGGGPLHAYGIAEDLGLRRIIVPVDPGLFSARGIALADFTHDYLVSLVQPVERLDVGKLEAALSRLQRLAQADLETEGVRPQARTFLASLDLRYLGQSTEINVALAPDPSKRALDLNAYVDAFHRRHEALYTYSVPGEPVELVNLRLRAVGRVPKPPRRLLSTKRGDAAKAKRSAWFPGFGNIDTPVWHRDDVAAGPPLHGPLIIQEMSSATIVPPGASVEVDAIGNLVINLPAPDRGHC